MSFIQKLNPLRRKVMRSLTRNIGVSNFKPADGTKSNKDVKRILISRPNHRLGNLLMVTPLLQEIENTFPNCKVDLFIKGSLGPVLFQNYENVEQTFQLPKKPFKELLKYGEKCLALKKYHYDIVVNIDKGSSSGTLATKFANADFKFFGNVKDNNLLDKEQPHMAKFPVDHFRDCLSMMGYEAETGPVPPLSLKLNSPEIAEGKRILKDLVKNDKKTITIFTFATGRKCYSEEWWENLYSELKGKFSEDHNIVEVLPVENVSKIGFKAPSFYSKDIRKIGAFIYNTEVFIGADSGIMHLASSVETPTLGLFSVSNPKKYGPYNRGSLVVDTNDTTTKELLEMTDKILKSNPGKKG